MTDQKTITTGQFTVELRIKAYASAIVDAKDLAEAQRKVQAMDWHDFQLGEVFDWETGEFEEDFL